MKLATILTAGHASELTEGCLIFVAYRPVQTPETESALPSVDSCFGGSPGVGAGC